MLRGLLVDESQAPLQRLRNLVHAFIRSECEEARMRIALSDAAPLYRDAPRPGKPRPPAKVFSRRSSPKPFLSPAKRNARSPVN